MKATGSGVKAFVFGTEGVLLALAPCFFLAPAFGIVVRFFDFGVFFFAEAGPFWEAWIAWREREREREGERESVCVCVREPKVSKHSHMHCHH